MPLPRAATLTESVGPSLREKMVALVDPTAAAVDGLVVAAVSTSNIASLSGLPVIDGYQTVTSNRVLLTAQTTSSQNGPWVVAAGAWTRPTDFANGAVVDPRSITVTGGTRAGSVWTLNATGSITVGTTAQTWVNAPALNYPTVIRIGPDGTWDDIVEALADIHAAGAGVVELMGTSYTGSPELLFTKRTVSMRGQGSGATILNYTGAGACIRWANSPTTVDQQGKLSGFTIRGNANANARGMRFVDTGTLPALDDIVVENFTGTAGVGIRIENSTTAGSTTWNERANGNRVHLNNNTIGMQLVGGGTADSNSFGYHRWLDLRLNVNANQIGIQSLNNAYVYGGVWTGIVNIGGDNAIVFDVAGTSQWLRNQYMVFGEETVGTGGIGVRVASTAYFQGHGIVALGMPNQNNNTGLVAGGAVSPSLRVYPNEPIVQDAGSRGNFVGTTAAKVIPWMTNGEGSDQAAFGRLSGANIESTFAAFYNAAGNAFVVYAVDFGQPIANAIEVGRFGQDGVITALRGLRPGRFTTAGRPTPAVAGAGTEVYDTTLSKPIWSDGTNWRDAAGTVV